MKHKIKISEVKSFEHILAASYKGTASKELVAQLVDFENSKELIYVIKKDLNIIGNTPDLVNAVKFYNEQ